MAACAVPTDSDALAVHRNLQNVRRFVARLSGEQIVLMMTFFEAFITRFMPYFADLATRQGSAEQEYTEVHGVVDATVGAGHVQPQHGEGGQTGEALLFSKASSKPRRARTP